ncbi:MAG: arylsulfatase [Limisphaerales bacterium]
MKRNHLMRYGLTATVTLATSLAPSSRAEIETTGVIGAPNATTTISGNQLPPPDPAFGGVIAEKAADSKSWWAPRVVPPKDAPNILLIMTDDCGFGSPSTFGGVIPTPALDRIATNGLRYTQFHSTSLCSPTRAALITGRNHHVAGFGIVGEAATGFPGYDSVIRRECGTVGEILKENGYATAWFGKDHNTPFYQASQAGPFDQWPTGLGFDYFYGFIGGDTSQWEPGNLFRNTTPIHPYLGQEGKWNLTTAMADDAIQYMRQLKEIAPGKPFFVYYVPGGVHAPHHPTKEWIDKISAMHLFDGGWDKLRETIFANQKRLGLLPANAELTPWPKELQHWDQLSSLEKTMFIKQADVFGAYLAYTDYEIGRVIQEVQDEGKWDNTLIIYISGDNGASAEGMTNGTPNEFTTFNGVSVPVKAQFLFYNVLGSDLTYPLYAAGWAWAFDTPFKWVKQVASHFGGTRQGMCMSWPGHITDLGGIRTQFHHVIDIAPTLLDVTGIPLPDTINGIKQRPMDGVSLTYTWPKENADLPSKRTTQYFEMLGNRAVYHDGWVAATTPVNLPWELSTKTPPDVLTGYNWELYCISNDFTEDHDLATAMPDKLKEMQKLFYQEAANFGVLPLDNSTLARFITPRPSATAGKTNFTYSGELSGVPDSCAPDILDRSYSITAAVTIPRGGAEGMIVTEGGRFGGYGLFLSQSYNYWFRSQGFRIAGWGLLVAGFLLILASRSWKWSRWKLRLGQGMLTLGLLWAVAVMATGVLDLGKGRVVFLYNLLGLDRTAWTGPALKAGTHTIAFDFKFDGPGLGKGGTGRLIVDGETVATKSLEHTTPIMFPEDETFDVGLDNGTPVSLLRYPYNCPFKFTGTIDKLTFDLGPKQLGLGDQEKATEIGSDVNN